MNLMMGTVRTFASASTGSLSVEAWRNHWKTTRHDSLDYGSDGQHYPGYEWIHEKEIRIFRMPDVDERTIQPVTDGK